MQLIVLCASLALADEVAYADLIQTARAAIAKEDWASAKQALNEAEGAASGTEALISNDDLVRLWFYRGVIEWRQGDPAGQALDLWRKALVFGTDYAPDADVLPAPEAQDVYYALREEQKGKDQVALALPEDPGDATIFVDGKRYEPLDAVYYGSHFIQVRCAEGNLVSSWHNFGTPPPDYLVLCSGGSYPVAGKSKTKAPKTPKEPKAAKEPKAEEPAPEKVAKAPKEPKAEKAEGGGGDLAGWVLMGVGGALVLGGTGTNFLIVNPAWTAGEAANADPSSVTADDAEAIIARFNSGRMLTLGLIGAGVVTAGAGVVVGPLLNERVSLGFGTIHVLF